MESREWERVERSYVDLGTLVGLGVEWVANADLFGRSRALLNKLVVDVLLDKDSGACAAALTVVEEETEGGHGHGVVKISALQIAKDDVGRLASQLESHSFDLLAGLAGNQLADLGGASESDLINIWVTDNGLTSCWTETGENVDDTSGETGLGDQLGNVESRERRLLSNLHHDRVASCQGWAEFPSLHEKREIPWNDLTTNTNWLVASIGKEVAGDWDRLSVVLVSKRGIVSVNINGVWQVNIVGDGVRLAVVQRLQSSQLSAITFHQVGKLVQELASAGSAHTSPW